MNEYETEEQQVEALKRWWKENGASLIIGLVVGVSGLFGWRYYVEQDNAHAVQASDMYMHVMQSAMLNTVDDKTSTDKLVAFCHALLNLNEFTYLE